MEPGINFEESISPVYVSWRAGTTNRVVEPARHAGNRFLGSLKGLQIRTLHASSILFGIRRGINIGSVLILTFPRNRGRGRPKRSACICNRNKDENSIPRGLDYMKYQRGWNGIVLKWGKGDWDSVGGGEGWG
jgi:hypothetical protein